MCSADRHVTEPAQVTKSDLAEGIDLVAANAVVGWRRLLGGLGLDGCVEDSERSRSGLQCQFQKRNPDGLRPRGRNPPRMSPGNMLRLFQPLM